MPTIKTYLCAQCGASFEAAHKRKFCRGAACIRARGRTHEERYSRSIGRRPLAQQRCEEHKRTHRICPECGREYRLTRHDNHPKGPQVHCSNHCRQAENRRSRDLRRFIQAEKNIYRSWAFAAKRRQREAETRRLCPDCGAELEPNKSLCVECRAKRLAVARKKYSKTPAGRARKAASKARRRSRRLAATIERFDPFEIFVRDGWRCHMCGRKTPKRLRGTFEDDAPELDHIIPLAAGGEHSRRNCACSCRKCNIEKGDKPLGQLRLAA